MGPRRRELGVRRGPQAQRGDGLQGTGPLLQADRPVGQGEPRRHRGRLPRMRQRASGGHSIFRSGSLDTPGRAHAPVQHPGPDPAQAEPGHARGPWPGGLYRRQLEGGGRAPGAALDLHRARAQPPRGTQP
ncbi:unnamed protein product [Ixodes hexagonus]